MDGKDIEKIHATKMHVQSVEATLTWVFVKGNKHANVKDGNKED